MKILTCRKEVNAEYCQKGSPIKIEEAVDSSSFFAPKGRVLVCSCRTVAQIHVRI